MSKGVMHELKMVSDEDCWLVFQKHAFDDDQAPTEELQKLGLGIVERCKGLPLAVKSVAGLLRSVSNPEEWRQILNSDIWQLQFQENLKNEIIPALWLSYHFLPPVLKRCFAYCSIFPKDYEFDRRDMGRIVLLWMAGGLLTPENGKRMEDVGEAYLQALISRSFFQPSGGDKSAMVMHDLVHDLAMFISGEFCFSCGDSNDLSNLGTKSRHLSYRKRRDDLLKLGAVSQSREKKLISLRTVLALPLSLLHDELVPFYLSVLELNELFLKVGGCVRVLSLSESSVTELPDSIGNMKYLRYLDLSWTSIEELPDSICTLYNLQTLLLLRCRKLAQLPTRLATLVNLRHLEITHTPLKELPDSICTLYNLQTLLLSGCCQLAQLPTRLAALVNLRHLDISNTPLKEMPPQMCEMRSLQRLSDFVLGENDGWRIKELGKFPLLEGRLRISGLEYIVDVKDVLEANLKDKKLLSELILEWVWPGKRSSQQEREVLEVLQPHKNLKKLKIFGYRGLIFPDLFPEKGHLASLQSLTIVRCKELKCLPQEGLPLSLSSLTIIGCPGLEERCQRGRGEDWPKIQHIPKIHIE